MKSIEAIDNLIVSLCEDAKEAIKEEMPSTVELYVSSIRKLCSSLKIIGASIYTVSISLDEKGNVRL